jgi:hypothetical protein
MNEQELDEKCKEIIKSDDFLTVTRDTLDEWGAKIVGGFLDTVPIPWKVSRKKIGLAYVIKISDEYLKYLLIMPHKSYEGQTCDQFYWMIGTDPNNDDHSISPDTASAYLINKRFPGTRVVDVRGDDGSSVTRITAEGKSVEVRFPPGFLSDKTWAKDKNDEGNK